MALFRLRPIILCMIVQFLPSGCAMYLEGLPVNDLSKFPKANENLLKTLRCLHGKVYPDDVDNCGVAVFSSESQLNEIEICLVSDKSRKVCVLVEKPILVGLFAY
jgi:hypothetical protein